MAGGTEFNRGKFKDLVLYLSQASAADEGFGMVKLNKLLYRADFEAFRLHGRSITGETYERQEWGPVAWHLPVALDELAASGYVIWRHLPTGPYTRDVPTPKVQPDMERQFSEDELRIIQATLEELGAYGAKAVSRWSHEESVGWNEVEDGQEIPYNSAFFSTDEIPAADVERARKLGIERDWASIRP